MTIAHRHYAKILIMHGDLGIIFSATHYNYNHNLFHRAKILLQHLCPSSETKGYFLAPRTWSKGAWTGRDQQVLF